MFSTYYADFLKVQWNSRFFHIVRPAARHNILKCRVALCEGGPIVPCWLVLLCRTSFFPIFPFIQIAIIICRATSASPPREAAGPPLPHPHAKLQGHLCLTPTRSCLATSASPHGKLQGHLCLTPIRSCRATFASLPAKLQGLYCLTPRDCGRDAEFIPDPSQLESKFAERGAWVKFSLDVLSCACAWVWLV